MGELRRISDSVSLFPECVDFADERHVFNRLGLGELVREMSLDEVCCFLTDWIVEKKRKFMLNPRKLRLMDIDPGGKFQVFFASMGKFEHYVRSSMRLEVAEKKLAKGDRTGSLLEWTLAERDRWQLEIDRYFSDSTRTYKQFCEALALLEAKREELLEQEEVEKEEVALEELESEDAELARVVDRTYRSNRTNRTYNSCEVGEDAVLSKLAEFEIFPSREASSQGRFGVGVIDVLEVEPAIVGDLQILSSREASSQGRFVSGMTDVLEVEPAIVGDLQILSSREASSQGRFGVGVTDVLEVEPTAAGKNTRKQVRSVRSVRVFKHLITRATGPPGQLSA